MTTESLADPQLDWIFDLKRDVPISNTIEKVDYHHVQTAPGNSALNEGNIVFNHNNNQYPIGIFDSIIKISGKFTKNDGVTAILDDNAELVHNWGFSLFKNARLEINGTVVEDVEDVRNATALLGHCLKSSDYCEKYGEMEGWVPDSASKAAEDANLGWARRKSVYVNTNKTFELMLPLQNIFGFCDVDKVLYLTNITLTLGRHPYNEDIFFNNVIPADAEKGKVILTDIRWMVRIYNPTPFVKTKFINSLMNDSFIPWTFMRHYTHNISLPAGSGYDWVVKSTTGHPRYVILGFKSTTINTSAYNVNGALFESVGITSLRVNLNGNKYPDPAMTFDFDNGKYLDGYLAYVNFCLKHGVQPPLSLNDWRKYYTIFVIDTSALAEVILVGSIQVQIEIKRTSDVAKAPLAYAFCLLLEDENNKGFKVGGGKFLEYK